MSSNFLTPPIGFGPGSQPLEAGDEKLDYMAMPQDMRAYAPRIPEVEGPLDDLAPALALLREVAQACASGVSARFDLSTLDAENISLISETLGEGEVAAKVRGVPAIAVQESVFAGVWSLNGVGLRTVEVGPIPGCVTKDPFRPTRRAQLDATPKAQGVINAPALLAELCHKSSNFDRDDALEVINLTLLPHTEEDLAWLDAALGEGAVTILSRGYGNCRITATALKHVWRVQFFNSMDTLILDTFEVTDVPEVALAAPEDLSDSGSRILKVLEAIA
ncbi:hydrogenase expression/formation protein [Roseibium sp. HPY-6]|uniref:hydrogenase expression/formation protein n=1 Tax=Roseibium sp. HPY-6 TaxID=3229852 RepID=UPI0033900AFA